MEVTPVTPADSTDPLVSEAVEKSSSGSKDISKPASEFSPPADSDIMDTHDEEAITGLRIGSKETLELANKPSKVSIISIDSRTSTLKYLQESFEHYRIRVQKLCPILWPAQSQSQSSERRPSGVARSRILDAVRIKKFRRVLFPTPEKEFIIERLAGGTYNRITGITVKDPKISEPKSFILRVPRPEMAGFGHIEREVAILRYIRETTSLPVADIVSFDPTINNPLGSGYVVQSRLPGISLAVVWDELTHEQRCTAAQDIGEIILALQSVTNSTPGVVEASSSDGATQKFSIRAFDIKSAYDDDWKAKIPLHVSTEEDDTATQDPRLWFGTQFGRWLAHELLDNPSQILYWDYQFQFVQVAKQMDALDVLGNGENCLCHFDLAARNVLVQILPNGSLSISGVVDWDSAAFAPKFVSCAPPSWLWTNQEYYDEGENETSIMPSTPEQEEIKEAFDDVVGFDWRWLAYRPEYRLARELFYFAQHGLQNGSAQERAARFLKEWAALYDSLINPHKDDESSKDVSGEDGAQDGKGPEMASE